MSTAPETDKYRYARAGTHLVCVDQPITNIVRTMLSPERRFALESLGISGREIVRGVLVALRSRLRSSDGYPVLPAFGHVAMAVHRGYKVFDLEKRTVTKVFSPATPEADARAEVDVCRRISDVRAAPRFIAADPDCRWYTEEFVIGIHGTESQKALSGAFMEFYDDVERCLLDLIRIEEPVTLDGKEYIEHLAHDHYLGAWVAADVDDDALKEIREFRDDLAGWLVRGLPSDQLQLVPSHGDFGLVNTIISGDEFRVIDWEGTRHGSLLADCFNFVFVEKYYGRAAGDLTGEMNDVAERYVGAVRAGRPDLYAATELPRSFAMRLYYLERLRLMLERDVTKNLVGVVRKSIRMFCDFDRAAGYTPISG